MRRFTPTLLSVALAFASMDSMAAVDLVLLNGKLYTADPAHPSAQAMAVQDGKVLKVGTDAQIKALAGSTTQVIDLGGKRVMPGMIDSHSHAIFGGLELSAASLADEENVPTAELEKRLRAWRDDGTARQGDVLTVVGVSSTYWAKAEELGATFNHGEWAKVPVVFIGSDHHTAWANQAMLDRAGIDARLLATLPAAERDTLGKKQDGTPNGFAVDAGWDRISAAMPSPAPTPCCTPPTLR